MTPERYEEIKQKVKQSKAMLAEQKATKTEKGIIFESVDQCIAYLKGLSNENK